MTDTFEREFLKCCRKYSIPVNFSSQGELHFTDIPLDEELKEDLQNKKCLVWLKNNQKGQEHGVIRNQVYISSSNNTEVYLPLNLLFEEVFHIWELYEKGCTIEWIYSNCIFHYGNDVTFEDIQIALWTLYNGKWNYILEYLEEDTYDFDFKKYIGRY